MNSLDTAEIHNIAALYGHVVDHQEWDQLDRIYTRQACYDGSGTSGARHEGLDAIRKFLITVPHPIAHHTTNIHLEFAPQGVSATGRAKWLAIRPDMSITSGYYEDHWTKTNVGWRLCERASFWVIPRP